MLVEWLAIDGVAEHLDELSAAAGIDLKAAGTQWDADAIRATEVAQPLIVATGLISARLLLASGVSPGIVAGHSVGEWTAAVIAGVLTEAEAMRLVAVRGASMASACDLEPTGMSAVLGGDSADVLNRLAELGLTAANQNGSGQVVAGGPREALAELAARPPEGARVMPLPVAGAFHTPIMRGARAELAAAAGGASANLPSIPMLSNADGALIESIYSDGCIEADGALVLSRLVDQVSAPVRWDLCSQSLASAGVTSMIELAPSGTLSGLARRGLPGIAVTALKPSDFAGPLDLRVAVLEGAR